MVWSDNTIAERMRERITPFTPQQVRVDDEGMRIVSYGLGGSGYDVRLSPELKFQSFEGRAMIDAKNPDYDQWVSAYAHSYYDLLPGECILGVTVEHIDMPDDVVALCIGKSTYARCGLLVNATPIEAGWRGYVTLELSNVGKLPIRVYTGEGIAQLVFLPIDQRPQTTYADRGGKYQNQPAAPVAARI